MLTFVKNIFFSSLLNVQKIFDKNFWLKFIAIISYLLGFYALVVCFKYISKMRWTSVEVNITWKKYEKFFCYIRYIKTWTKVETYKVSLQIFKKVFFIFIITPIMLFTIWMINGVFFSAKKMSPPYKVH